MINRVVLVGRLTKDPDLRYTQSGIAVANFTVACNRPFKNEQGEHQADYIQCVIWRKPAESLAQYMSKGSLIGLEGSIQTRNYEGDDGKRVYVTEVLAASVKFLESRNSDNRQNNANTGGNYQTNTNTPNQSQGTQNVGGNNGSDPFTSGGAGQAIEISDDELPF